MGCGDSMDKRALSPMLVQVPSCMDRNFNTIAKCSANMQSQLTRMLPLFAQAPAWGYPCPAFCLHSSFFPSSLPLCLPCFHP